MKNILMIGTGGTIASGQTAEGLAPELDPSRLLQDTPRVAQLCRVDCLQLYSLDSTNIRPCHWLGLARAIREILHLSLDGFRQNDAARAARVEPLEQVVDTLKEQLRSRHILRLQEGKCSMEAGFVWADMLTDLERIGDHASDIAELILRIKSDHAYHIVQHLPAMAASAQKMVHDAVEAFIKQDVEEAEEIIRRDDEVDALFNQVKSDVVELLKSAPSHADQGIDLLMIAKYLERIGDHAVNVCEWTQFCKTGALKNVRIM
mgnify:CR=1 FL=1